MRVRRSIGLAGCGLALAGLAAPAEAYLFWTSPALAGAPASGTDPTVVLVLPNATEKEATANLVWTLRAGLNVAALQCQFAPQLRTVENYNNMLRQHAAELQGAYTTLNGYFKRTVKGVKPAATAFDQFTTRTYNSFSTLQAQRSFCDEAASIGRETMVRPRGELGKIAVEHLRELRTALVPVGDSALAFREQSVTAGEPSDLVPICFDKRGREKPCKK